MCVCVCVCRGVAASCWAGDDSRHCATGAVIDGQINDDDTVMAAPETSGVAAVSGELVGGVKQPLEGKTGGWCLGAQQLQVCGLLLPPSPCLLLPPWHRQLFFFRLHATLLILGELLSCRVMSSFAVFSPVMSSCVARRGA